MGNADFAQLQDAIYSGDSDKSLSITESILAEGLDAKTILNDGLIKGMEKVGVDFKNGDLFLPEVLLAARAMKASMTY
jgi:5-methyltetrahydrofolate--homocysteine methyltransferase